jgi:uncharacterized protein YkwD
MKRYAVVTPVLLAALALATLTASAPASLAAGKAAAACPTAAGLNAPAVVQEGAMLCLVNRARGARGLAELTAEDALVRAADHKSADILRCDSFSHEACGRPFTYWIEHFGSRGCASAENIAWWTGSLGGVRSIFRAWMHSAGHRENILGPYGQIGIGLRIGTLEGNRGAHVWTEDFAAGC